MDDEIKHIIAGMSGVELVMLENRGLILPSHLHEKGEIYRRLSQMREPKVDGRNRTLLAQRSKEAA